MEVKERRLRLKEESRTNILDAALSIARTHGWQTVSMRKIADMIEHTPPVIYDYFLNKEAILLDLAKTGFVQLAGNIEKARSAHHLAEKQLENMWMAYWDFAFAEKELYQLMFGINIQGCSDISTMPEAAALANLFGRVIRQILPAGQQSEEQVFVAYAGMWATVHGLISLNVVYQRNSGDLNQQVLLNAVRNVAASLAD
ncbi:TetR/AcrR family transcriptional regulator [Chitinophaga filiformis]|uniref:TetR/AcrR family transcriptional regulator n=1 Tax=Chitinophaga filiformis TaxID=104663 RepID=UPI001F16D9C8|nr:TetR/AcrR family transcriptional regulator [Chitinophaga filiformis]MCF6407925.1 TetR/AcrR family transcriptional regulator [Chitinophaga filiformis]